MIKIIKEERLKQVTKLMNVIVTDINIIVKINNTEFREFEVA